jgi:hypothetical protein
LGRAPVPQPAAGVDGVVDEFGETPREDGAEARRSATPLGDRILIGLAAMVLLAGALIAGGNLLKALIGDESATASSSPVPSGSPAAATTLPTPTHRPPREVTVVLGTPRPEPSQPPERVPAWLEVLTDAPLMSSPVDGREIGVVPAGSIVLGAMHPTLPGWVYASESDNPSGYFGWVQTTGPDGAVMAIAYPLNRGTSSGDITTISAASGGYVALGDPTGLASVLYASADGEQWELTSGAQQTSDAWFMADGPSGLLAVSQTGSGSVQGPWEWESSNGRDWSAVGSLYNLGDWPSDLVGSDRGYLLELVDVSGWASVRGRLWFSPDGLTWQESLIGFGESQLPLVHLLAVDGGFVAWQDDETTEEFVNGVAFSSNGRTWTAIEIDVALSDRPVQLASAGPTLLGLAMTDGGAVHAWRADLADGASMHLERDPSEEATFPRLESLEMISDGGRAYALGFDVADGAAHLWESDGSTWIPVALPDAGRIGPSPRLGAVGPNGLVLIGSRPTTAGSNPVIWHLRSSGSWVPEPDPIIPLVPDPDPGPEECGPLPTSALEFAVLPQLWGPACFGDEPMTFTAWSMPCGWFCVDEAGAVGDPAWLMGPYGDLWLSPLAEAQGGEAILAPGVIGPSEGGWVRVTGHYADPASDSCSWRAGLQDPAYTADLAPLWCRTRFVITAIEAVDGP